MADANSYRRKSEKYRRCLIDYEMRLENNFDAFLELASTTEIQDQRNRLIDLAKRNFYTLRENMKMLRGF